jgi:hypothetical protein
MMSYKSSCLIIKQTDICVPVCFPAAIVHTGLPQNLGRLTVVLYFNPEPSCL